MTTDTSTRPSRTARPGRTPLDRLFAVLSDPHRRRILMTLAEGLRDGDAFVRADLVAAADVADRDRFAIELHHIHLPLLEAAGYVEWDPDAGTVRPGPEFPTVASCLGLLSANAADLPGGWP